MKKYIRIIAFVLAIGLLLISVLSAKAESFPMPYEEFNGTPMPEEIGESSEPYGVEDLGIEIFLDYNWYLTK